MRLSRKTRSIDPLQTIVIEGRKVTALYNEGIGMDVRAAGRITRVEKISDIKFDLKSQEWTAVDRKIGKVVARDKSRKNCVLKEHQYYERELAQGRTPWS